jgi:short-subunit dehydrogenase
MDFRGKTVAVSGASSGIGEAVASLLAGKGAKTGLIARREADLDALAGKIRAAGGTAVPAPCDITDKAQVAAAFDKIKQELGPVEALFIVAGVGSREIAQNASGAEAEAVMRVNYLGPVFMMERALPDMQRQNKGMIVAVSSLASYRGLPGCGSYCASKAALATLLESWSVDLQATNIKICVASPYYVSTAMSNPDGAPRPKPWKTAAEAAEIIVEAAEKERSHTAFPWSFRLFMTALRVMPAPLFRMFWRLAKRGG